MTMQALAGEQQMVEHLAVGLTEAANHIAKDEQLKGAAAEEAA